MVRIAPLSLVFMGFWRRSGSAPRPRIGRQVSNNNFGGQMPSRSHVWSLFAGALLISGSVLAVPFPDEFTGPPSYSLMGCPYNEEWTPDVVRQATGLSDRVLQRIHRKFGFSPARVCASEPQLIAGFVRSGEMKQNKADEPDMALAQRAMQMRDENGQIPPDALLNALVQRQQILEPPPGKSSYLPLAAGVTDTSWTWLGPGNIGGRVRAISPNPSTPNDILIGSVSGGIWRTTNGRSPSSSTDDLNPNVAISCLVRDPTASATVYACTGEGVANIDSVRGLGLFKSTTSGASWSQVPTTNPATAGTDWYYVNRLAIHPTSPALMLAAAHAGLYRTTNGNTASPTWTKVYETVGAGVFRKVMDVSFHPTDGNIAVLGEGRHSNCTTVPCVIDGTAEAYSNDAGATWSRTKLNTSAIGFTQGRVEVAFSKSSPNIVYALVDMSAGQLYKSTDSGATWTPNAPVSTPAHLGSQGW